MPNITVNSDYMPWPSWSGSRSPMIYPSFCPMNAKLLPYIILIFKTLLRLPTPPIVGCRIDNSNKCNRKCSSKCNRKCNNKCSSSSSHQCKLNSLDLKICALEPLRIRELEIITWLLCYRKSRHIITRFLPHVPPLANGSSSLSHRGIARRIARS